nr:MAG TPA: DNA polymerase II small subunit [Caudoviricetes sp.]
MSIQEFITQLINKVYLHANCRRGLISPSAYYKLF